MNARRWLVSFLVTVALTALAMSAPTGLAMGYLSIVGCATTVVTGLSTLLAYEKEPCENCSRLKSLLTVERHLRAEVSQALLEDES
jgi:hypothetical protein